MAAAQYAHTTIDKKFFIECLGKMGKIQNIKNDFYRRKRICCQKMLLNRGSIEAIVISCIQIPIKSQIL